MFFRLVKKRQLDPGGRVNTHTRVHHLLGRQPPVPLPLPVTAQRLTATAYRELLFREMQMKQNQTSCKLSLDTCLVTGPPGFNWEPVGDFTAYIISGQ